MKILVVDDERPLVKGIKFNLENEGYEVDCCYDGATAVALARANAYGLIILDLMMPEKDGIRALQEMRKKGIRTPCMMLTARDAVEDRVAGLDAGADDYLPKPFDAGELLARVRAMLRRRKSYVPDTLHWEDLTLDKGSCELRCGGAFPGHGGIQRKGAAGRHGGRSPDYGRPPVPAAADVHDAGQRREIYARRRGDSCGSGVGRKTRGDPGFQYSGAAHDKGTVRTAV